MNMTDFSQIGNMELEGSRIHAADDFIKSRIFTVRGLQVVVDRDLAELYGVQTKVLNQAVKRNANRFPPEFMFVLAKDEMEELVTNCDRLDACARRRFRKRQAPAVHAGRRSCKQCYGRRRIVHRDGAPLEPHDRRLPALRRFAGEAGRKPAGRRENAWTGKLPRLAGVTFRGAAGRQGVKEQGTRRQDHGA